MSLPSDIPPESTNVELDGFPIPAERASRPTGATLDQLVERFTAELRSGRRPAIADYVLWYPDLADEIRDIFPLIASLEQWKSEKEVACLQPNADLELPFERLGNYQILRELGRGGMGVVYEAIEARSQRRVAIKVLRWRYLSAHSQNSEHPIRKEQFQREARTIAGLRHRNIVPVFTFGEQDGYCYYVMPLLDAVGLDWIIRRLRERPEPIVADEVHRLRSSFDAQPQFPENSAGSSSERPQSGVAGYFEGQSSSRGLTRESWTSFARIGAQVSTALVYAHQQRILHNDIKPGNLLIDSAGLVVVTDFGVGRLKGADFSDVGDFQLGTLRYMAPERLYGQSDERSDVYSLGVTLYELLSLTPAFASSDRAPLIDAIVAGNVRPPRKLVPAIPVDLETIILTAMAVRPGDRYPSARELTSDLIKFANGQPISARRPSLLTRAQRWWAG